MTIDFTFSVEGLRPETGQFLLAPDTPVDYLWGMHDYQIPAPSVWTDEEKNRDGRPRTWPKKKNVPETITRYEKSDFITLRDDWAWYWYRNLVLVGWGHFDETRLSPGEREALDSAWLSLTLGTRVITNDNGWNDPGYHDPITGATESDGVTSPMKIDQLAMGGNVYRPAGEIVTIKGEQYYPVECLDMSQAPPDIAEVNAITRPDLFPRATIIMHIQLADGTFQVDPFPQMMWRNAHTVLMSVSRSGVGHIPVNRLSLLGSGPIPNPYNPPRVI